MNPKSMQPYAMSLLNYLSGDENAETIIHRDDGLVDRLPASFFFREKIASVLSQLAEDSVATKSLVRLPMTACTTVMHREQIGAHHLLPLTT